MTDYGAVQPDTHPGPYNITPADVTAWLQFQGWSLRGSLADIAERWGLSETTSVVVPLRPDAPDFSLRWSEMLTLLSSTLDSDRDGVLLAIAKSGSDIAEFRAAGQIDDSIPLGDASTLLDGVRRAMQAAANSALQPRNYYGHSLPDVAREHARNVRVGQTRRGSYVVPIISRLPIPEVRDDDDALLFAEVAYEPFARKAMHTLAEGVGALRELTHATTEPTNQRIVDSVPLGVSSDLCDAVATVLETESINTLAVGFSWADRLPTTSAARGATLESEAVPLIRKVGHFLRSEPVVGRQTLVGYVKGLNRGEDDDIGRIQLRALVDDKPRTVLMDLNDEDYHIAGGANTDRLLVSATGQLVREPGRALRFSDISSFRLVQELPSNNL